MKKIISSALLFVILLFSANLSVLASDAAFIYTDKESGLTFTVPAYWKQEAFIKDREYIDVKFVSTKEEGCMIIYGSTDIWAQMPASDKIGYTRADLNNSLFTCSDIALAYNTSYDKVSKITYNGKEYFKVTSHYTTTIYDVDLTVETTMYIHYENGWMYTFHFGGPNKHKVFTDFESVLKSVQFPTFSTNDITPSNNSNRTSTNPVVIVVLIVVLVILGIGFSVARRGNVDEDEE